ncbi:hypothetical protein AAF712_005191 [Marasmius tenuissimus]|uniref:Uncharacterized protein n=1 Tax=Marasmius tenuissimus TaxID=585030 RepID=A0ABR3A1L1_9AGAR
MADPEPKGGMIHDIVEWGNKNGAKIAEAYSFNGGWEGWVQVELAMAMKKAFSHDFPGYGITVTREDVVYDNKQRSDLLISTSKAGQHFTNMLELKCETSRVGGASAFRTAVAADCDKVNKGQITAMKYLPCKAWVIAFSVTKDLKDLKVEGVNLQAYPKRIDAKPITITLYYGVKYFRLPKPDSDDEIM